MGGISPRPLLYVNILFVLHSTERLSHIMTPLSSKLLEEVPQEDMSEDRSEDRDVRTCGVLAIYILLLFSILVLCLMAFGVWFKVQHPDRMLFRVCLTIIFTLLWRAYEDPNMEAIPHFLHSIRNRPFEWIQNVGRHPPFYLYVFGLKLILMMYVIVRIDLYTR